MIKKNIFKIKLLFIIIYIFFVSSCSKKDVDNLSYTVISIDFNDNISISNNRNYVSETDDEYILKTGLTYELKGDINNKRIRIDGDEKEFIILYLDNLNIKSNKASAIYSPNGCKVHIWTKGTTNITNRSDKDELYSEKLLSKKNAIYVKGELYMAGSGILNINGSYNTAVECKKLTVYIGDYNIDVDGKAFDGKESVNILGGNINIKSNKEAMQSEIIYIEGGKIDIKSGDDGINATSKKQIKKDNQTGVYFKMSGGELYIDAMTDGIDSNGDFYIEGGEIFISASTSDEERIIDYNGSAYLNNGEMIAVGPYEKIQDFGDEPNENYIIVYFDDIIKEGTEILLYDKELNKIISYTPPKSYKAAIITSKTLIEDKKYKVIAGKNEKELVLKKGKNEIR